MSYDVYLRSKPCEHCGRRDDGPNWCPSPTYNLTPIFDLALADDPMPDPEVGEIAVVLQGAATKRPRGLRLLSGMTVRDSLSLIERALARIRDTSRAGEFRSLEPDNGWGTLDGAEETLEKMRSMALDYPDLVWEIR